MIRALATAASGMDAQQTRLDVTANNIANVSTPGFKKSRAEFQDLMYQTLRAAGAPQTNSPPMGLQVGMGVRTVTAQRMHTVGDQQQTGNQFDVSIEGDGFFVVQMPNGEKAYTRAGNFHPNADGKLVTQDGHSLSSEITIPPNAESVTIGPDGVVTAAVKGDAQPVQVGKFELAHFVNPAGLTALGRNLFHETVASGQPITGQPGEQSLGTLQQSSIELSNVKVVEEMVDLIAGQRAYEVNSKVIKAADEMLGQTANIR